MAGLENRDYRARIVRACILWSPAGFAIAFFLGWIQGGGLGLSSLLGAVLMAGCLIAAAIIHVFGRHAWIVFIAIAVTVKLIASSL